jgi:hypothetical protein
VLEVDVHEQAQRVAGETAGDAVAAGRQVLDELGEAQAQDLVTVLAGGRVVAHHVSGAVAGHLTG